MSTQPKRWEIYPRAPASHFEKLPDVQPLILQILYNRGITTPQDIDNFLNHRWPNDDPFALRGMRPAVERINQAIAHNESIAVYGDYDADGVTSTALMMHVLAALGAKAEAYIPNRFEEGYGLNNEALFDLANRGVKVVLTVDCGIRSVTEVAYGNSLGLDMIITDHHTVGDEIPPALAAINPKQAGCTYPFKELAGVGLAYKLTQALLSHHGSNGIRAENFLDLVALGTVADLAPLYNENRKLVNLGLKQLNQSLRPGLTALMSEARSGSDPNITAGTIGFTIGPRLNAAGRLDSALAAYNLLMAQDHSQAKHLAVELDQQNRARQKLTKDTVAVAQQVVMNTKEPQPLYFISHPDFNPGVVGLAASRLCEELYRPVLVAEQGPETTKGSARSIAEFHITEALDQCADLLVRYGGHAAAAGFTVKNENLVALQRRLVAIASQNLAIEKLQPTLTIDGQVNLRGVKPALVEEIINLQPFGYGNPTPRFVSRNLRLKHVKGVGHDQQHLRLVINDGKQNWSGIAFRQGHWATQLTRDQEVDIAYSLEFNHWKGETKMQLNIKDLRPSGL